MSGSVELVVDDELVEVAGVVDDELVEVAGVVEQVRVPVPTQPVALAWVSAETASTPSAPAAKAALSTARWRVLIG